MQWQRENEYKWYTYYNSHCASKVQSVYPDNLQKSTSFTSPFLRRLNLYIQIYGWTNASVVCLPRDRRKLERNRSHVDKVTFFQLTNIGIIVLNCLNVSMLLRSNY